MRDGCGSEVRIIAAPNWSSGRRGLEPRLQMKTLGEAGGRNRLNADEAACPAFVFKCNDAGDFCKKRVVSADADIFAGLELCSSLPDQNGAAADELTAESFDAEPLRMTVAAIS